MYYLGLDTSNYTTSAAVIRGEEILCDERIQLAVPPGKQGLRQSEALYQHWQNLPQVLHKPLTKYAEKLIGVCVSRTPRPVEGSYMPVFNAGVSAAKILSEALKIPLHETSHQEGHLKAGAVGTNIDFGKPLIAAHLSGGTLEFIKILDGRYDLIGGSKDLSYGKLIDRTGVLLGLNFPAGKVLDDLALSGANTDKKNPLGAVFREDAWINLSGTETQIKELVGKFESNRIASFLFERISESLVAVLEHLRSNLRIEQVLITGGVASSQYIRMHCADKGYQFGTPTLCSDNAAGVALLKGQSLCQSSL
ncbi:MAG: hypothetical protein PHT29_05070 [Eubacteriales bacterium]|nr:hypothetical protein [Eubacteriales bacterium]MDD3290238.1 hypothetical protein [Eubacteriales bacterium]